jgi:phosphoglycolate phosphatase
MLVDTSEVVFGALGEVLPMLDELGLVERLLPEDACKTPDDAKLVRYIRIFRRLHPRILAERRVSRTDVFDAIFGDDTDARHIAHQAYNACYRRYFGRVRPFQAGIRDYLLALKRLGIRTGIATNRSREFLDYELQTVDDGEWAGLIDTTVCADDVTAYKPDPEILHAALATLDEQPGPHAWYVGDSYVDIVTAHGAGLTGVFYNGACWEPAWFERTFPPHSPRRPAAVLESFDGLMDLLESIDSARPRAFAGSVAALRPARHAPPQPPPPRVEPDWHPAVARLTPPRVALFDWHATLVDTLDAMYRAVDDTLPELNAMGLLNRMVDPAESRSPEDARLVIYVQSYNRLHPKIHADRKISRTDIFEVLFGSDEETKQQAHAVFKRHYRRHYGAVRPFEPKVRELLDGLRGLGLRTGVITNRDREFFEHELRIVDGSGWADRFDVVVCGDDTPLRKPHPDQLLEAVAKLGDTPGPDIWYIGDSTTDTASAKRAGVTSVFFNGAQWDLPWLQKIFPGTPRHPHKPDVVVNDFSEFWALVLACRG